MLLGAAGLRGWLAWRACCLPRPAGGAASRALLPTRRAARALPRAARAPSAPAGPPGQPLTRSLLRPRPAAQARLNAKIDSKAGTVVMGTQASSIQDQLIEKAKGLSVRTFVLANAVVGGARS